MNEKTELRFLVAPEFDGCCVREFLRACDVSATLLKAVKKQGGFWIDETPVRTCDVVRQGQAVRFCLPPESPTAVVPQDLPICIAYESEHVMVVDKPAGMAVHPTLNYKDGTLANAYMGLLKKRGQSGIFRPVNRLDKDTSGLVLLAKNVWAAPILAKTVCKQYYAIVEGLPAERGIIDAPIGRAPNSIILRRVDPEGKPSLTEYVREQNQNDFSLVRILLHTGRTHQIRVHFSHIGHPLAGDELYGGSRNKISRHALHCTELFFEEPVSKEKIRVRSVLPQDMAELILETSKS
ncbi:ribosomal large subunit pseudouridine synthase D [gut metagenome]|uniref:Ribosomal large subunit pseudouridine synthase D n=1 Tax=gut metagenome TaxID=749906 RepID=J9GMW0_9ZZZZ